MIDDGKAEEHLIPLEQSCSIESLIAEYLVTPAPSRKRVLVHSRVRAKGTVSDLVVEHRR